MMLLGDKKKLGAQVAGKLVGPFGNAEKSMDPGLVAAATKIMDCVQGKDVNGLAEALMDFVDIYDNQIPSTGGVDPDDELGIER